MWMRVIDESSSSSSSSSVTTIASPSCALVIASAYEDGPFTRTRRLPQLKSRLQVNIKPQTPTPPNTKHQTPGTKLQKPSSQQ